MTTLKLTPQPGYIALGPLKEEEISGILISDNMANKDSAGVVVAIGDSYTILEGNQTLVCPSPVKIGDKIIITNYGEQRYMDFNTGEHIRFVKWHPDPRYNQIMAVINE